MARFALVTLFVVSASSCSLIDASSAPTAESRVPATPAIVQHPATSPTYEPGPASASGTIVGISPGGVVVRSHDGELNVDLSGVRSVWKETEVAASDLEVGDQLDLNGTRSGRAFRASYVWANIGRFDGVVQAFVGQRLEVAAFAPNTRILHVELSQYLEIVSSDGTPATVADIKPGVTLGGVMYRPMSGTPRATRIWLWR